MATWPAKTSSITRRSGNRGGRIRRRPTAILTFTGTASVATYQTLLRSITYRNTSDTPSSAARSATFQVFDGVFNPSGQRAVNVIPVNDLPVITVTGPLTLGSGVAMEDTPYDITYMTWSTNCSPTIWTDGDVVPREDRLKRKLTLNTSKTALSSATVKPGDTLHWTAP